MGKKKTFRRKEDKYAHLNEPQAELDYHGLGKLTEDEIRRMAEDFVDESAKKGLKRLLIITGKGLHSADGPVIKPLLSWYLNKLDKVKRVETARRDRGGEGALEVELH